MGRMLEITDVHGGMVTYPPGATFGPRRLRDLEVVWIVEGEVVYQLGEREVPAPPGSVVLARPGTRDGFRWDPDRATRHGFFHCTVTDPPEDWPAMDRWPSVIELPGDDVVRPLLRYVIGWCVQEREPGAPAPMTRRAIETLLGALLVGPLRAGPGVDVDYPEPVARALELVREMLATDPTRPLRLADLASAAAVSREHLCRLFSATFDAGPMEAVRLLRLDMAAGLMARSNLSLKQIADRCGFSSPYHFSRAFRRAHGEAPSRLRGPLRRGERTLLNPLVRHAGQNA